MARKRIRRIFVKFDQVQPPGTGGRYHSLSIFSLVMVGILVLGFVILAPIAQRVVTQTHEVNYQRQVVNELNENVNEIASERKRWDDPAFIKAQARERLYYVMPGETSLLVIDDRPNNPAGVGGQVSVPSSAQQVQKNWKKMMFYSIMGAGLAPEMQAPSEEAPPADPQPKEEVPE